MPSSIKLNLWVAFVTLAPTTRSMRSSTDWSPATTSLFLHVSESMNQARATISAHWSSLRSSLIRLASPTLPWWEFVTARTFQTGVLARWHPTYAGYAVTAWSPLGRSDITTLCQDPKPESALGMGACPRVGKHPSPGGLFSRDFRSVRRRTMDSECLAREGQKHSAGSTHEGRGRSGRSSGIRPGSCGVSPPAAAPLSRSRHVTAERSFAGRRIGGAYDHQETRPCAARRGRQTAF